MAKLNLKDFIRITGKTSITDWVKYNWLGVPYGPGPEPEPEEVYMSITGHPLTADIDTPVKTLLQVTVVYDDSSSRELGQDEYSTNIDTIIDGPNEIIVTYKNFTATCTIIGVQPQPVPEFEDFKTAEYYANKTTRLNDLITNIDVEGIRPPAFMNYSYSTYQLPEGQTAYLNGRFEQAGHPIEDKGFNVEFTLNENTMIIVNVCSASHSVQANVAILDSNNEFVSAASYNEGVQLIDQGLYSVPSQRTAGHDLEITYDLAPGTYRLGTPCQTSTQGLRIYGIYKPSEAEPLEISVTEFEYEAEVGTLVKDHLHEVILTYSDGSSKILDSDEYTTTNALIYEGENILDVWYNENPDIVTTVILWGYEPQPIETAILNADDFDIGTTTGNYGSFSFPGSQEVRSRVRTWTDPDDSSITKEWNHSFKRPVIDADATNYNKLILWMSNGSSSAVSRLNIYNDDQTYSETFDTLLSSSDVIKIEAIIPEGIYHISWSTGTPDIHEIQLIKE